MTLTPSVVIVLYYFKKSKCLNESKLLLPYLSFEVVEKNATMSVTSKLGYEFFEEFYNKFEFSVLSNLQKNCMTVVHYF